MMHDGSWFAMGGGGMWLGTVIGVLLIVSLVVLVNKASRR